MARDGVFLDVVDDILNAQDADVWDITRAYLETLGCDTLLYAYIDRVNYAEEEAPFTYRSTAPDSWFEHYFANDYHLFDHVARMRASGQQQAITLGAQLAPPEGYDDKTNLQLLAESGEVGFQSTVNFWLPSQSANKAHDVHCITIGTSQCPASMKSAFTQNGKEISIVSQLMHNRLSHTLEAADYKPLSKREKECLLWVAMGLRPDRIAEKIGIATPTVNFHLVNSRKKLRAKTLYEALAKAIRLKFIAL